MNTTGFEGFLFMNAEGQYLQVRERTTHTGRHVESVFVEGIDHADVFTELHLRWAQRGNERSVDFGKLTKLRAKVENTRTVTLLQQNT